MDDATPNRTPGHTPRSIGDGSPPPNPANLRVHYERGALRSHHLPLHPLQLLKEWFRLAVDAEVAEPNAICLATASADGAPSARTVLCKGFDDEREGIHFFTNYMSRKGRDLTENPRAAAVFFWRALEKQVCVRGTVDRLPREVSEAYFNSRPYSSQIGAMASDQHSAIPNREALDARAEALCDAFPDGTLNIPLPDDWGGFVLTPDEWEFWQGRPSRLHDRFQYRLPRKKEEANEAGWVVERLNP